MDRTLDGGPICVQSKIKVLTKDLDDLQEQIHQIEHKIYPLVVKKIAEGKIAYKDGKIIQT